MKILALAVAFLCSSVLASPVVQAAGKPQSMLAQVRAAETQVWERSSPAAGVRRSPASLSSTHSPVQQVIGNGTQLRLPSSAFPAASRELANFAVTATEADQNTLFGSILANANSSFKAQGTSGGWYERYAKDLPNHGLMVLRYLGTYYSSADAARAVFDSLANAYVVNFAGTTTCSYGDQCIQGDAQIADDAGLQYIGTYRQVLKGNAIFQGLDDIGQTEFPANKASGDQGLDGMTTAFLAQVEPQPNSTATPPSPVAAAPSPRPATQPTPQPTAGPTSIPISFNILSVRGEKANSEPDFKLAAHPVTKITSGGKLDASMYVSVNSAPLNSTIQTTIVIKAGRKTLLSRAGSQNLGDHPAGIYRFYLPVALSGTGTFHVVGRATINGQSQQRRGTIKVVAKKP